MPDRRLEDLQAAPGPIHHDLLAVAALVDRAGLGAPPLEDVAATRAYLGRISEVTRGQSPPLEDERRILAPTGVRDTPCKLYMPEAASPPPLMFYCHGGGFRHGELEWWDAPLRQMVRQSGVAVLSIDYAMAPEHKFPAAFDEIVAVIRKVVADQAVDGTKISGFALGGDSAGANLALAAALALRDEGVEALRYLLLFYGVYSKDVEGTSWRRLSGQGGRGLSASAMRLYWRDYLPADESDWRVEPLFADLRGLPETRLIIGELDPLMEDKRLLAHGLAKAGVQTSLDVWPGLIHGVLRFNETAPVVRQALAEESRRLKAALA